MRKTGQKPFFKSVRCLDEYPVGFLRVGVEAVVNAGFSDGEGVFVEGSQVRGNVFDVITNVFYHFIISQLIQYKEY